MEWLDKLGLDFLKTDNPVVDEYVGLAIIYIIKIVSSVGILVLGIWGIKKINTWFETFIENKKIDTSVKSFLKNFISTSLKFLLAFIVLNIIGVKTTSIVAVLGATSFAIGLALQGSLANFAGGILIIFFRPFKVGDVIEAHNKTGKVKEIQLFNTILNTSDNKTIIIPNSKLTGDILTNYTKLGSIQADIEFKVKANVDINIVRKEVKKVLVAMPEILNYPVPAIFLKDFDNDKVTLILKFNIAIGNSTSVIFAVREQIYFLVKKMETEGYISEENSEDLDLGSNLITSH
ncbi:MAG: mechanosensitive ion channel family protein [Chitinophagales bacterium]|nr:mechanosensitive ion channel family protein [Chitinophagales bacterium]